MNAAAINPIWLGVMCGAGAGAFWGLVFLAPELAGEFDPVQLAVGRYLAYGVLAAAMILPRWRALAPRLARRDWLALLGLGLAGNIVYYVLVSLAVQTGGIAMTSLVVGFLPVTVTVIGSRFRGAVPLARLAPSLLFGAAGALCIGWQSVAAPVSGSVAAQLLGLAAAFGALAAWTVFAVGNSLCLARLKEVSAQDWNLVTGVVTGGLALLLVPLAAAAGPTDHTPEAWLRFLAVSAGVAVFASILGNALWNRMSRLLPLTMAGQMISFETLFALLYGFAWEQRLPTFFEIAAFACLIVSVAACVSAHRPRPAAAH